MYQLVCITPKTPDSEETPRFFAIYAHKHEMDTLAKQSDIRASNSTVEALKPCSVAFAGDQSPVARHEGLLYDTLDGGSLVGGSLVVGRRADR